MENFIFCTAFQVETRSLNTGNSCTILKTLFPNLPYVTFNFWKFHIFMELSAATVFKISTIQYCGGMHFLRPMRYCLRLVKNCELILHDLQRNFAHFLHCRYLG